MVYSHPVMLYMERCCEYLTWISMIKAHTFALLVIIKELHKDPLLLPLLVSQFLSDALSFECLNVTKLMNYNMKLFSI